MNQHYDIETLLQEELDGVLTASGRAELDRLLAAHPELAEQRRRLQRLGKALAHVPACDPPPGLVADIMAALPRNEAGNVIPLRKPTVPVARRTFAALAAALAVLAIGVVLEQPGSLEQSPDSLSGTMISRPPLDAPDEAVVVRISLDSLQGSIRAQEEAGALRVDLDLDAADGVQLVLARGTQELYRSTRTGPVKESLRVEHDPLAPLQARVEAPGQPVREFLIDGELH